jgi:hypothetical protein
MSPRWRSLMVHGFNARICFLGILAQIDRLAASGSPGEANFPPQSEANYIIQLVKNPLGRRFAAVFWRFGWFFALTGGAGSHKFLGS